MYTYVQKNYVHSETYSRLTRAEPVGTARRRTSPLISQSHEHFYVTNVTRSALNILFFMLAMAIHLKLGTSV